MFADGGPVMAGTMATKDVGLVSAMVTCIKMIPRCARERVPLTPLAHVGFESSLAPSAFTVASALARTARGRCDGEGGRGGPLLPSPSGGQVVPIFVRIRRLRWSPFSRALPGGNRFALSYMRYNGKWFELFLSLSLDECLEAVRDDWHFLA